MPRRPYRATRELLAVILLGGCAGVSDAPSGTTGSEPANAAQVEAQEENEAMTSEKRIERRKAAPSPDSKARYLERVPERLATPVSGEVPASILETIKADLAARLDIDVANIRVTGGESVTWPDGSLGCARPGQAYTQAPEPGYRVVLAAGGSHYDYRVSERGYFILCDEPSINAPGDDRR